MTFALNNELSNESRSSTVDIKAYRASLYQTLATQAMLLSYESDEDELHIDPSQQDGVKHLR